MPVGCRSEGGYSIWKDPRLLGLTHAGTSRENMNQEVEFCLFLVFSATVYEDSEITSQRLGKYIALCLFLTYQSPSSRLLLEVWQSHRTALPQAASGF